MKKIVFIVFIVFVSFLANATLIVPHHVSKKFHEEYPHATHVKWKHINHEYEVHFALGDYERAALFDKEGNELKSMTFIEHFHTEEVEKIESIVRNNHKDAKIVIVARYEKNIENNTHFIALYEVDNKLYEMYFDDHYSVLHLKEFTETVK